MQASPASNETRLPRAVLRRSAAIEERIKARTEPQTDPAAPPTPPGEATATPAEPNLAPPAPPVEDPRHSDPEYWKQRFKVIEGRLRAREDEHRAEVAGFHQQISELQNQVQMLQASAPAAPIDLSQFLTAEQIDTLGTEEANAVVATAMRAAQMAVDRVVETQVKPLRQERQNEQAQLVEQRKTAFVDALVELVPDFDEVDKSAEWIAWLEQKDPVSKVQRGVLLDNYIRQGDAASTADLFKAFKKSAALPQPPITPNGSASNSGEPPPPPSNGLVGLTGAEIKDYYKRSALGSKARPAVTDQERVQFEARLKLPRRQ